MKSRFVLLSFLLCSLLIFLSANARAGNKRPFTDSTCCSPDSLKVVSVNFPVFCVQWQLPADSNCRKQPLGFEIQWRKTGNLIWKTKFLPYVHGNIINFCDSLDSCGTHNWQVRTKCNDTTYSAWTVGTGILSLCPPPDSTCCAPDSLKVVSVNFPVFCVKWKLSADSNCRKPLGFEIRWKRSVDPTWKTRFVPYVSGTIINFCDSLDICGTHAWQVRTKCNDTTYSDWITGPKLLSLCNGKMAEQRILILPNPATESITMNMKSIKEGRYRLSVVNMYGNAILQKELYVRPGEAFQLSITGWQRGVYHVSILDKETVIGASTFVKE